MCSSDLSFAGDGSGANAAARNPERHFAERLFDRLFTGGDRGAIFAAGVGLAADVLDLCVTCVISALHSDQGAGVRSVETASCRDHRRSPAGGGWAVATLCISCSADDVHYFSVAR